MQDGNQPRVQSVDVLLASAIQSSSTMNTPTTIQTEDNIVRQEVMGELRRETLDPIVSVMESQHVSSAKKCDMRTSTGGQDRYIAVAN